MAKRVSVESHETIDVDAPSRLEKYVCDWMNANVQNYDDMQALGREVMRDGLASGLVTELYKERQCRTFVENLETEIGELIDETLDDGGMATVEFLFKLDHHPKSDYHFSFPLFYSNLAWFAFEETLRKLMNAAGYYEDWL